MLDSLALTTFPLAIIAYLRFIYRAEQDFRRAVERALIRNREVKNAYTNGYVAGFEVGKCSDAAPVERREEERTPAPPVRDPVELKFWGRDSTITVSRPDILHVEQETRLSPMMVYLYSRGNERPLACAPSENLYRIIHTRRLDRWINAQRLDRWVIAQCANADDIDF